MQWVGADWAVNSVQGQSTAGTLFKWKQNVYEMKLQDIYVIFLPITKELFPILSMFACAGRVLLEVWVYSVGCTAKSICRSERCLSKPPYCLPGRQLSLINTLLQVHHLCYEFMVRFLFRPRVHRAKMSCGSGGAACIFPVGKDTERNKWLVNHRRNHMERKSLRLNNKNGAKVRRSAATFLLWIANKWIAKEK